MEKLLAMSTLGPGANFSGDGEVSRRWFLRRLMGRKKGEDENKQGNTELQLSGVRPDKLQHQGTRRLCFAPEFDGLHCFESIVSY